MSDFSDNCRKLCVGKIFGVFVTSYPSAKQKISVQKITAASCQRTLDKFNLGEEVISESRTVAKTIHSVSVNGSGPAIITQSTKHPIQFHDGYFNVSRYTTVKDSAIDCNETVHYFQKISDVSISTDCIACNRISKVKHIKEIIIVWQPESRQRYPPQKPARGLPRKCLNYSNNEVEDDIKLRDMHKATGMLSEKLTVKTQVRRSKSLTLARTSGRLLKRSKSVPVHPTIIKISRVDSLQKSPNRTISSIFSRSKPSCDKNPPHDSKSSSFDQKSASQLLCVFQKQDEEFSTSTIRILTDLDDETSSQLTRQLNESFDSLKRDSSAYMIKPKFSVAKKPKLKRTVSLTSSSLLKPSLAVRMGTPQKDGNINTNDVHQEEVAMATVSLKHSPRSLPREYLNKQKRGFSLKSVCAQARPSLKISIKGRYKGCDARTPDKELPPTLDAGVLDVVYNFSERLKKNVQFSPCGDYDFDPETSFVELSCLPGKNSLAFTRDDSRFLDPALRDELKDLELFHDMVDDFVEEKSSGSEKGISLRSPQSLSCNDDVKVSISSLSNSSADNFPKLDIVYDKTRDVQDDTDEACITEYILLSCKEDESLRHCNPSLTSYRQRSVDSNQTENRVIPVKAPNKNRKVIRWSIAKKRSQGSIKVHKLSKVLQYKKKSRKCDDDGVSHEANTKAAEDSNHDIMPLTEPNINVEKQSDSFISSPSTSSASICSSESTSTSTRLKEIALEIENIYHDKTKPVATDLVQIKQKSKSEEPSSGGVPTLDISSEKQVVEKGNKGLSHQDITEVDVDGVIMESRCKSSPPSSSQVLLNDSLSEASEDSITKSENNSSIVKSTRSTNISSSSSSVSIKSLAIEQHTIQMLSPAIEQHTIQMLSPAIEQHTSQMLSPAIEQHTSQMLSPAIEQHTSQMLSPAIEQHTSQMLSPAIEQHTSQMLSPAIEQHTIKGLSGQSELSTDKSESSTESKPLQDAVSLKSKKFPVFTTDLDKVIKDNLDENDTKHTGEIFQTAKQESGSDSVRSSTQESLNLSKSSKGFSEGIRIPLMSNEEFKMEHLKLLNTKSEYKEDSLSHSARKSKSSSSDSLTSEDSDRPERETVKHPPEDHSIKDLSPMTEETRKKKKKKKKKKEKTKRVRRVTIVKYVDEFGNCISTETKNNTSQEIYSVREREYVVPKEASPTPAPKQKRVRRITRYVNERGEELTREVFDQNVTSKCTPLSKEKENSNFHSFNISSAQDQEINRTRRSCRESKENTSSPSTRNSFERRRIASGENSSDAEAFVDWKNSLKKTETVEFPKYSGTWDSD